MKPFSASALLLCTGLSAGAADGMSCTFSSVTGLAFSGYNAFNPAPLDTSGLIVFRCDAVTGTDSIRIQLGTGNSTSYFPRTLRKGNLDLEYNLYLDASHTLVWGDGGSGTNRLGPVTPADGVDTPVSVFGRIEPLQNVQAGTYEDTIVVTIIF